MFKPNHRHIYIYCFFAKESLPIGNIAERDMMSADAKQGKRAGSGGLWRKVKRKQRRTNKHDGMEMTDHQDYMNGNN